MPRASEKASAIAMVNIPPIITGLEWVLECRPTISPSVVITPEVIPKLIPVLSGWFIAKPFSLCSALGLSLDSGQSFTLVCLHYTRYGK